MADDDFGADPDFLAALASAESRPAPIRPPGPPKFQQPTPQLVQRVQQPTPQKVDRGGPPPANASTSGSGPKLVQPTPQALPARQSGSSILVSPRQKKNPVLTCLKSMPWELSDIPADFVLGLTTCALFLSLKYHRLHPDYIDTRIANLKGRYNLRVLLTMVDIDNHEESLRELSKKSLVSNVTLILCWSAAEAARYLELYKSYEHANFAAIRGQQASSYAERLVEFVTVPRSVNKSDAVALVSTFGSLRNAINADPEQIAFVSGWGEKKMKSWYKAVEQPFRVGKASKRRVQKPTTKDGEPPSLNRSRTDKLDQAVPLGLVPLRSMGSEGTPGSGSGQATPGRTTSQRRLEDDEEAMIALAMAESLKTAPQKQPTKESSNEARSVPREDTLSEGVAAALAKLRQK